MAKTTTASPKRRGRPKAAVPNRPVPVAVTLRGRAEWVAWLDSLCVSLDTLGTGIERTQAIDYALKSLAERQGFAAPPSRL